MFFHRKVSNRLLALHFIIETEFNLCHTELIKLTQSDRALPDKFLFYYVLFLFSLKFLLFLFVFHPKNAVLYHKAFANAPHQYKLNSLLSYARLHSMWRYVMRADALERIYRYLKNRDELVKQIEEQKAEIEKPQRSKLN